MVDGLELVGLDLLDKMVMNFELMGGLKQEE
jgi:hypothetical protein